MNYDDYYARQVGGALPYFTGARVQRGHGFGRLFSGLLRSVAPLIRRGAVALGKRALTTGAQIAKRCRGWSERQEGSKTKGNGCRKRPDGKPSQHTTTSR